MLIKYAKVTEVSDQNFYITFLGETIQSKMQYKRLSSYTPNLGDMVAVLEDKLSKKLIIGRVE